MCTALLPPGHLCACVAVPQVRLRAMHPFRQRAFEQLHMATNFQCCDRGPAHTHRLMSMLESWFTGSISSR